MQPEKINTGLLESALQRASTRGWRKAVPMLEQPVPMRSAPQARLLAGIEPWLLERVRKVMAGAEAWPLTITGPAGTGKTCAALAVLDHVRCSRKHITAGDFVDRAMKAARGDLWSGEYRVSDTHFWTVWESYGVTCMDELGTRDKVADWHYDIVKRAIDRRHGRPCIWISNLSLEQLEAVYDDRIASRLAEGTVLEVGGADRRVQR